MTEEISHMFITGPKVIETVTGEKVGLDELGGANVHNTISGVAHFSAKNEAEALNLTRHLLSYIPDNNAQPAPFVETDDDPWRMPDGLNSVVPIDPAEPYDMRVVIESVFDLDSFLEVHAGFAPNAVIGFARLHGQPVAVIANQPMVMAGVLDINASDKIARFVRFADAFNIPLVTFVDTPGFMPGVKEEYGGIIRHGAKVVYAYAEATVPKLAVITRKAYGGAYIVMSSKHIHTDFVYGWPTAEIAVMGAEGAVNILYSDQLNAAEDGEVRKKQLVDDFKRKFASPYASAAGGHIDDILIPAETRPKLIAALELLRDKNVKNPQKKHGNIPL
jgi:acetyl-CoA carboxylase carboxyltransferase component